MATLLQLAGLLQVLLVVTSSAAAPENAGSLGRRLLQCDTLCSANTIYAHCCNAPTACCGTGQYECVACGGTPTTSPANPSPSTPTSTPTTTPTTTPSTPTTTPTNCPSYPTPPGADCDYTQGYTTCYDVPSVGLTSGSINGKPVGPYCCAGGCSNGCYPRDAAGRPPCTPAPPAGTPAPPAGTPAPPAGTPAPPAGTNAPPPAGTLAPPGPPPVATTAAPDPCAGGGGGGGGPGPQLPPQPAPPAFKTPPARPTGGTSCPSNPPACYEKPGFSSCYSPDGSVEFCCTGGCPVNPPGDPSFQCYPQKNPPGCTAGSESGTGVSDPTVPQPATSSSNVGGRTVTNSPFFSPIPNAPWTGGVDTCTGISGSNTSPFSYSGVPDSSVFFKEITHNNCDGKQWTIKVGTGGQIYSLKTPSNGNRELIGPQQPNIAFVDRVFQSIVYYEPFNNIGCPYPSDDGVCHWEIHSSGGQGYPINPSPVLAHQLVPHGLDMISWGRQFQANIEWTDARFRSNLYVQTNLRDVGQGAIEITWTWTNTGSIPITYGSILWSGLRFEPDFVTYALGQPQSQTGCPGCQYYDHANCDPNVCGTFGGKQCWNFQYPGQGEGDQGLFNCRMTSGWMGFLPQNTSDATTLGVVFARQPNSQPSQTCEIRFGRFVDPGDVYGNIIETIHRPNVIAANGGSFSFRFYLSIGSTLAGFATQALSLQGNTFEQSTTYTASQVGFIQAKTKVPSDVSFANLQWYATDKAIANALPILIVRERASGQTIITTSPYVFSCCKLKSPGVCDVTTCVNPSSTTDYRGIIGWGVRADVSADGGAPPAGLGAVKRLSQILPSTQFIDPQHPDTYVQADVWVAV